MAIESDPSSKVAIVRCDSYDEKVVERAVRRGIGLLGGLERFIGKDEKVLLKPNMLSGKAPEKAVTTHPSVFRAVAKLVLEGGYNVKWGDSPGVGSPEKVGRAVGIAPVADELGIGLADFQHGKVVRFEKGVATKRFDLSNAAIEADAIISLPKMKTHQLTRITGAVKNQLGCVYGLNKPAFHTRFPDGIGFSKMLVDLNMLLKPRLFIMDGVVAMEGNGPGSGDPISMNVILISSDPVALDSVFARMINLDKKFVPTLTFGQDFGLGTADPAKIELLGDSIDEFYNPKFDVVRAPVVVEKSRFSTFVRNLWVRKPVINSEFCIKCGVCVEACPLPDKALSFKKGKKQPPVYDYGKCIRCYCCQEMCPKDAIDVKTPLFGRILLYR